MTYSATDPSGTPGSATRTVNVVDTTAPAITCPVNLIAGCGVDAMVPVIYPAVGAYDGDCGSVSMVFNPPSGSVFAIGTSNVTCTATDASGNTSTCHFSVTRAGLGFTGFLPPIGGADATGGSFADPLRA